LTEVLPPASFRTIGQLADLCGQYCWLENRLFEVTGSWASSAPSPAPAADDPTIRVFLSEMSAQHALFAGQWRDRLPARAGVDADALVVPPPGGAAEALTLLDTAPDLTAVLAGLIEQFLPRLGTTYDHHLAQASAVAEGPVRAVLELAVFRVEQELQRGWAILRRESEAGEEVGSPRDIVADIKRVLGNAAGVFPAARAS
jgi:hypothetical protein